MAIHTLLFASVLFLGLLIIYPIAPRYFQQTRLFGITCGVVLAHIGIYGLLWYHANKFITASLLMVEGGIFVIWDPFKLCPETYKKLVRVVGNILMALGLITSLSFFTHFPIWLWIFPAAGMLLPYLIPPLQKYIKPILAVSLGLILLYLVIIGVKIYHRFNPPLP